MSSDSSARLDAFPSHPSILKLYHVGKQLGKGCFAKVFEATKREDDTQIAIKVIDKKPLDSETTDLLHKELRILQAVSEHPGIVTMVDSLETDTHMYFFLEYVDGGPLLDRIVSRGSFSENDARILLRTLLRTLHFLAELGCVHRDIKPENILVDNQSNNWPVKLTDFGLSENIQPHQLLHDPIGTPLFVAPEILTRDGYDCACDMWSLGVVLYIVLCGYPPFPIYDDPQKLKLAVVTGDYSFPSREWMRVSADAKAFVKAMLQINPKERLKPSQALRHPWILMAQSTTDLPNTKLKSFNARRKLKAGVMAVRTTFGFRNSVEPGQLHSKTTDEQKLIQDVERYRTLIAQMSTLDNESSDDKQLDEFSPERSGSMACVRSLINPVDDFNVSRSSANSDNAEFYRKATKMNSGASLASDCEAFQSKALAMAAEAKESLVRDGVINPFLAEIPHEISGAESKGPGFLDELDFQQLEIQ